MKKIAILYNATLGDGQKKLAHKLSSVLKKERYETRLVPIRSDVDTDELIKSIHPKLCQLILSINMAGYNLLSTDSAPSLNALTVNIVNYIEFAADIFDVLFDMRMNYTMSFLFSTREDADYVKQNHPALRHVYHAPCIEEFLPVYLAELDWRY